MLIKKHKKLIYFPLIIILVTLLVYNFLKINSEKIRLNDKDVYMISIKICDDPSDNFNFYIKDKKNIKKIVNFLSSSNYYFKNKPNTQYAELQSWIILSDRNGKTLDSFDIYNENIISHDSRLLNETNSYYCSPFFVRKLYNLCKSLK